MTEPSNVLFVTVDSLRADCFLPRDVSRLGMSEGSDPEWTYFEHAYATGPGTSPSFPGMLTGTLPLSFGGLGPLREDRPRMAAHLSSNGLATAGFQCNPFLSRYFNYDVGFDTFEDYQHPLMGIATRIFPRGIEINNERLQQLDDLVHFTDAIKKTYELVKGKPRPYVSAEVITDDAVDWLGSVEEPFFCWAHYMDVHHPCYPPPAYRERNGVADVSQAQVSEWYSETFKENVDLTRTELEKFRSLYDAAIDYTLDQVKRLIDGLVETGRYDDTLVVFTSDHGHLFGEHGEFDKPVRMYDEMLKVPLVVANGPESLSDATDDLVSLLDIPPLIHDALEFEVPREYDGRVPGRNEEREYVMAEHEAQGDVFVGARSDAWVYEANEIRGDHGLFDVRDGGFDRVTDEDNSDAFVVKEAVLDRLDSLNIDATRLEEEVEGDVKSRLEDLGYL